MSDFRRRFYLNLLGFLCVLVLTVPLAAQNASVTGTIIDPGGLAVSGASVTLQNEATNIRHETISSSTGNYSVPGLESGSYTVSVAKDGFETMQRTGVTLFVATATRLDLRLSIGHQNETVTVTGDASLLQTDSAQLSTSVSRQQYDELPLVQQGRIRSPTAFVYLAPSVQGNYSATGSENTAATNYISVNGSQMKLTEFYLSGLSSGQMASTGSYTESAPPVDAIQEFKMITTLLPADYGHTGAAAGIFAVRNGTNNWHASIYEYFRNNVLDAQPWGTVNHLFTRQNEFGATIGGPVLLPHYNGRNRSFFFFSYGGSRKSGVDSLKFSQIPTAAEIGGDFTGAATIYDPATTRLNPAGTAYIRDPFPNNKIPANRINSLAAQIASYYPAPNSAGTLNYQAFIGERVLNPDVYTTRVDHNLTDTQHMYFTFITTRIPRILLSPSVAGLPQPLASVYSQFLRTTTVRINHDWTLNPHMLNSLAIGYYRLFYKLDPGGTEFTIPNQISPIRPDITFTNGYASISTNNGQNTAEHQYLLSDIFYWTHGSHNVRTGGEFRRVHSNVIIPNPGSNTAGFSNLETANPANSGTTGDAFASFLLGNADSGSLVSPVETSARYLYSGVFVQDDWKLNQRLTVNLGVRWEMETVPTEANDKSSSIDLNTPNPGAGNLPGALIFAGTGTGKSGRSRFAPNRYTGFSPRLGMAFAASSKLAVHAGYGLYYQDLGWNTTTDVDNYGFAPSASYKSPDTGVTPAFSLATGFPGSPSLQPAISPVLLNGQSGNYRSASVGYMPYIEQWSAGMQYSPSPSWSLEAAYVGTSSHKQLDSNFENVNQVDPKYLSLGSTLTLNVTSVAAQSAGIHVPYAGFTGTVAQALRAYPQYLTLTSVSSKSAYSNYNAAQLIVTKRTTHGLHVSANYTFAKNLGINSPSWMDSTTDNVLQDSFNPRAEYSISPIDVQHALVLTYSYDLPFGHGSRFLSHGRVMNALVGGWKVSGIQRYQSGFPLPIKTSNSLPIFNRVLRPNIVPGVDRSTHLSANQFKLGSSRMINKAAFTQPASFTFGNAKPAYSDVRSFPVYTEDFAAMKETALTEKLRWSVGVNFFNAFNRHRFTSFDTTWSDAAFGQSTAVSEPRFIQLDTRFTF